MMIHAYSEDYLNNAQKILGDMMDYAVNTYEFSPNQFYEMFLVSDVSMQFQTGNPTYVAGKTGCELVKEVIRKSGLLIPELEDEMYLDKSPEYWCGWALAYYQWSTSLSFAEINQAIPVTEVRMLYTPYHEMDVRQFVDKMNELYREAKPETNLKELRTFANLSQSELAQQSGVSVRTIQQYEQRRKDINKAQTETLLKIARVLVCKVEDLVEKVPM